MVKFPCCEPPLHAAPTFTDHVHDAPGTHDRVTVPDHAHRDPGGEVQSNKTLVRARGSPHHDDAAERDRAVDDARLVRLRLELHVREQRVAWSLAPCRL